MTKKISVIILLLITNLTYSQNKKIVEILNKQLQMEYNKYYDELEKENFELIKPYQIDENGILSFSFSEQL